MSEETAQAAFDQMRERVLRWMNIDIVPGDIALLEQRLRVERHKKLVYAYPHPRGDSFFPGSCDICNIPYAKGCEPSVLCIGSHVDHGMSFVCGRCAIRIVLELLKVTLPDRKEIDRWGRVELIALIEKLR